MDQTPRPLARRTLTTYRYLRVGMVGAVGFLATAVLLAAFDDGLRFEQSISAYWYTDARPVFVSTLVAIGIALVVIEGANPWEDTFLNFAGIFAPVVALVPTILPGRDGLAPETMDLVVNGMGALLVTGAVGIAFAVWLLRRGDLLPRAGTAGHFGLLGTGLVYLATTGAFLLARDVFIRWAHNAAAVGMFACMAVAVWITARTQDLRNEALRPAYLSLSIVMAVTLVAAVALRIAGADWPHLVLVVEVIEVTAFALFWALQTWELWHEGERPDPGRQLA